MITNDSNRPQLADSASGDPVKGIDGRDSWSRRLRSREGLALVALLTIGFVIRVVYSRYVIGLGPGFPDSQAYLLRAEGLRDSWTIQSGVELPRQYVATSQPPLFGLVLGILSFVASTRMAIAVVLSVASTATIGLVWWATRREFGPRAAMAAAVVATFYVHIFIQPGLILSEVLVQLLVAVLLVVAPMAIRTARSLPVVAVGMLCALLALTRAELLVLLPFVGVSIALGVNGRERLLALARAVRAPGAGSQDLASRARSVVAAPVLLVVGFAFVYSPWAWYTNALLGQPVPSTGSGVYRLATSCESSLQGEGVGYRDIMCNFGLQIDLAKEDGKRLRLDREADALTVDRLSSDRAAERVAESGVNMGGVRALRVGRGFGLYRPFDTANLEADEGLQAPGWLANVQAIQWLGVMAIASAGAITARRRGMPLAHVLGLIVAAVVAMALGFGASRYRAALDPAFAMLAGAGAVAIADSWRSGRRAKKVVGGEYKPGLEGSAGGSSARFE